MLTDTHCHLDFDVFDEDRDEVLNRSWDAGLERILLPGIDLESSRKAVELAEGDPRLYAAIGVHPNESLSWEAGTLNQLEDLAKSRKVVAVGEIGLDYYRDRAPRKVQREILAIQLDFAAERGLPVVIHNRQATDDLLHILLDWQTDLVSRGSALQDRPGVLHSYSDAAPPALRAIDHRFFIGLTGPVTFHNAPYLQRVAASLPLEHTLIETDAPFLTPHPYRGRRNEPAHVRLVAEKIADIHGIDLESVAQITTANARRLFQW